MKWLVLVALPLLASPRFEGDVLPILTKYCFTCHGQSSAKLGLDLRTAAGAMRGSFNGPVIIRGKPDESLLWKQVSTRQMPPAIYGQKIPDADLETIRQWIEAGAPSDAVHQDADVPAIITTRCVSYHGPKSAAAGLRLDTVGDVLKGSATGPVIVEGFSDRSLLVRRISNGSMPPKGSALTVTEIASVREWIDSRRLQRSGCFLLY